MVGMLSFKRAALVRLLAVAGCVSVLVAMALVASAPWERERDSSLKGADLASRWIPYKPPGGWASLWVSTNPVAQLIEAARADPRVAAAVLEAALALQTRTDLAPPLRLPAAGGEDDEASAAVAATAPTHERPQAVESRALPHELTEPAAEADAASFTAIVQTYDRPMPLLQERVAALAQCAHLHTILIVDNHPENRVLQACGTDGARCWPALVPPGARPRVHIVAEASNSMNNRLRPRPDLVRTTAILLLDDDLAIPVADLDFAFTVWSQHPRQLVSFITRAHAIHAADVTGQAPRVEYVFGALPSGEFSIGLAGCAFFHRDYLERYWAPRPSPAAAARDLVDEMHNCDDLALNFLVGNATGLPVVAVAAPVVGYLPMFSNRTLALGMSTGRPWRSQRTECLNRLAAIYDGRVPLQWSVGAHARVTAVDAVNRPQSAIWEAPDPVERTYVEAAGAPAVGGIATAASTMFDLIAPPATGLVLTPRAPHRGVDLTQPWTAEAWVAPTGVTETVAVVATPDPLSFILGLKENRAYLCSAGGAVVLQDEGLLPLDRFTHLAAVYTGQVYRLHVNGRLVRAGAPRGPTGQTELPHNGTFTVGANLLGRTRWPFAGRIQEVRLWARARTTLELEQAMPLRFEAAAQLPPATLIAQLPLGSVLHDTVGTFDVNSAEPLRLAEGLALTPSASLAAAAAATVATVSGDADGVTAVITSFRRPHNVHRIVQHLAARYPFITEVVIWNNNASAPINVSAWALPARVAVRAIDSSSNLFTEGKYLGCISGRHPTCYVQDDDFVPTGVRGLYASYRAAPHLLHVTTDTHSALLNHKWTFVNETYGLHAGFTWLGAGSMLSQSTAERFLRQMDAAKLDADARAHADLYMSLWTNELPVMTTIALNMSDLDQDGAHSCRTCLAERERNNLHFAQAVRLLTRALRSPVAKPAPLAKLIPTRDTKTVLADACARLHRGHCASDLCTFVTNVQTWPCILSTAFDVDVDLTERLSRNLSVPFRDSIHFVHAVDDDRATAWRPLRPLRPGDHFGLDLRAPTVVVGARLLCNNAITAAMVWEVSFDGRHWELAVDGVATGKTDGGAILHSAGVAKAVVRGAAPPVLEEVTLTFAPARIQGIRVVVTSRDSALAEIYEFQPILWAPPPPPPPPAGTASGSALRVAFVVDGVLDAQRASPETRALVDEAALLAASGGAADVAVLVPGRTLDGNQDALDALTRQAPGSLGPRLVVVPKVNQSYTVAPSGAECVRIALDLLQWFHDHNGSWDLVVYPVYQSPLVFVLRAHELGLLAPATVFAARNWQRTSAAMVSGERFVDSTDAILALFLESSALAMADVVGDLPAPSGARTPAGAATPEGPRWRPLRDRRPAAMSGAAVGTNVRRALAAPAAAVVRSVVVVAVFTPGAADADWNGLAAAIAGLPAPIQADLSLLTAAVAGAAVASTPADSPVAVAPAPVYAWADALAFATATPARVLWLLDRSAGIHYWAASAAAAGAPIVVPSEVAAACQPGADCVALANATVDAASEILQTLVAALRQRKAANAPPPAATTSFDVGAAAPADALAVARELHAIGASVRPPANAWPASLQATPTKGAAPYPKVTVCVPVYGRTDYLAETLASIRNSTYPADRLEVVVADDGSAAPEDVRFLDNLAAEFAKRRDGWAVLRLPHRSPTAARNAAIARARGKYVLMFDSDDLLRPHALVRAVEAAERVHADVVVGWVQTFRNREDSASLEPGARRHIWAAVGADAALGMFGNAFGGGSALFLRSALTHVGGYRDTPAGTAHLDYALLARVVLAGGWLELVPEVFYDYRADARNSVFHTSRSVYANQRFSLGAYRLAFPAVADVLEMAWAAAQADPSETRQASVALASAPHDAVGGPPQTAPPAVLAEVGLWVYINMAHRVDRNAHILRQLALVGAPPDRIVRIAGEAHRWPVIGCSRSHVRALQRAAGASVGRWVAILEDDFEWANADSASLELAQALLDRPDFDVLLGAPNPRMLRILRGDGDTGAFTVRVQNAQSAVLYIVRRVYLPTLLSNMVEGLAHLEAAAVAWEAMPAAARNDTRFDRAYALDQYWKRLMPEAVWIVAVPSLGKHWASYSDIEGRVYGVTPGVTKAMTVQGP